MPERLWSRSFLLMWAFTFLTFFAAFQLFPTAPLRLLELGATKAESGRFLAFFTLGSALGALATGQLADRLGLRRMLGLTATIFVLIMLAYAFDTSRWSLYLLAPLHGAVWSGLVTAQPALLGKIIPTRLRAQGMSWYGLASPGGVVFGPTCGVAIYQWAGWRTLCLLLVPCFAVLIWLSRKLPADPPRHEMPKHPLRLPEPAVFSLSAILFFVALSYGSLTTYSAQEGIGLGFPWPAAFLSCLAIGMVAMRLFMGFRGFGHRPIRMLPYMALLAAIGLALMAYAPGGMLRHILSGLIYGAGYSMIFTLLSAEVLEVVTPERTGSAFGSFMFAFDAGIGLGSFAIGLLIGKLGYRWGWSAGLMAMGVAIWVGMRIARRRAGVGA